MGEVYHDCEKAIEHLTNVENSEIFGGGYCVVDKSIANQFSKAYSIGPESDEEFVDHITLYNAGVKEISAEDMKNILTGENYLVLSVRGEYYTILKVKQ